MCDEDDALTFMKLWPHSFLLHLFDLIIFDLVFNRLSSFLRNWYMGNYGHPWTFSKTIPKTTISFSSLNYLTFPLVRTSIFITTSSFFLSIHQHGYERQINMCLFMSMIFILIYIRFDIDINNDELLETI